MGITLRKDSRGKSKLRKESVCVCGLYVCVNELQVWMISQSQVWGMMGTGVQLEMVNIQGMAPSHGGAREAVQEPPL